MILRHLTEKCLRLRSLSISATHLHIFPSIESRLVVLLPRLSQLCITTNRIDSRPTTSVHVNLPFTKLSELFNMVERDLQITDLRICSGFRTPHSFDVSHFLSKLPHLRRLAAPITVEDLYLHVTDCPMVEEVRRVISYGKPIRQDPEAYLADLMDELARCKISGNVKFIAQKEKLSLLGYLMNCGVGAYEAFAMMEKAGITTKISPDDACAIACELSEEEEDIDDFKAFLKLLVSNEHPLLPNLEDVKPAVRKSCHFQDYSCEMSAETIRLFVETFGLTSVEEPFLQAIELFVDFSTEIINLHEELGFINHDIITSTNEVYGSLFSHVEDVEALEWLLEKMSNEDARRLLRHPRSQLYPAIVEILAYPELVEVVQRVLGGATDLFAFLDPSEFARAADRCIEYSLLDSLKLITESTGWHNISADTQGVVLLSICTSGTKAYELLDYWLQLVTSPMNGTPPDLKINIALLDWWKLAHFAGPPRIFRQLSTTFLKQASQQKWPQVLTILSQVACLLVSAIASIRSSDEEQMLHQITDDIEFMISQIFFPLVDICVNAGKCSPTCLVFERLSSFQELLETDDGALALALRLVDICATHDFHTADNVSKSLEPRGGFADLLVRCPFDSATFKVTQRFQKRIMEKWIDKMDLGELNTPRESETDQGKVRNVMDTLLSHTNRDAMCYLPDMIRILAKRGCRISSTDRNSEVCLRAHPEALELYFEIVYLTECSEM
jgi:hypothetical protein